MRKNLLPLLLVILIISKINISICQTSDNKTSPLKVENKPLSKLKKTTVQSTTSQYCTNTDFEIGNFSNWNAFSGTYNSGIINITNTGVIYGEHTIVTGVGIDNKTGYNIPIVAPNGGNFSCRLGNDSIKNHIDRLTYSLMVTSQNDLFFYNYAAFLMDPTMPPFSFTNFYVDVVDPQGNQIDSIINFFHISGSTSSWQYKSIDLSSQIGNIVTIRFTVTNGSNPLSFAYVYLDAGCSSVATGINKTIVDPLVLKIYPNPSSEKFQISYNLGKNSWVNIEVFDLIGKKLGTIFNSEQEQGDHTLFFQPKDIKADHGIYFLKFSTRDKIIVRKIIFNK